MNDSEKASLKAELQSQRIAVLDKENEVWKDNCMNCKLIQNAIASGELGKGTWKDRKNPICDNCSVHYELRDFGRQLDVLLNKSRRLRG